MMIVMMMIVMMIEMIEMMILMMMIEMIVMIVMMIVMGFCYSFMDERLRILYIFIIVIKKSSLSLYLI